MYSPVRNVMGAKKSNACREPSLSTKPIAKGSDAKAEIAVTHAYPARFTRLRRSGASKTLRHQSVTVQMVSNPSWYAVIALPYLMEYPHQCAEQVFNRLYANALARHIAQSDPKIRRVFDVWKNTPGDTLDSPLEKTRT